MLLEKSAYILKQNGKTVWFNDAGKDLLKEMIDVAAGVEALAKKLPITGQTIHKMKHGYCSPESFDKLYAFAQLFYNQKPQPAL